MLKAPGSKRLKLRCDELLSKVSFKFNLRRYHSGAYLRDGWNVLDFIIVVTSAFSVFMNDDGLTIVRR